MPPSYGEVRSLAHGTRLFGAGPGHGSPSQGCSLSRYILPGASQMGARPQSSAWATPEPARREGAPTASKSRGTAPLTPTSAALYQTQMQTVTCGFLPPRGPRVHGPEGQSQQDLRRDSPQFCVHHPHLSWACPGAEPWSWVWLDASPRGSLLMDGGLGWCRWAQRGVSAWSPRG